MHLSKVIIVLATVSSSFAAALQTLRSGKSYSFLSCSYCSNQTPESTPAKAIDDSIFERADVGKSNDPMVPFLDLQNTDINVVEEKREEASTDADAAYGVYERGEESIDADAAYGVYEQ